MKLPTSFNRDPSLENKSDTLLIRAERHNKNSAYNDRFLTKVVTAVEQHLDDPLLSVDLLANEIALSHVQLYRKVKLLTGLSPNEFIRNMRLEKAAYLLARKAGSVADVAFEVGFQHMSYFAKCFKEKYGNTPSEFLKR